MAHGLQQRPAVSAVITLQNAEQTLARAAESVLSQPLQDLQLVLVVMPSNDRTLSMAQRLQDREIRVDVVEVDSEDYLAAVDAGFDAARGRFLVFMHQEEWFGAGTLARMVQAASDRDIEYVIPAFSFDSYHGSHRRTRTHHMPVLQAFDLDHIHQEAYRYIEDEAFGFLSGKLMNRDRMVQLGMRMFLSGDEEMYMFGYLENLSSLLVLDDVMFHTPDPLVVAAKEDPTTRYQRCERDHQCLLRLQHAWKLDEDKALSVAIHRRHLRHLVECIKDMATHRDISSIERSERIRDMLEAKSTRQTLSALEGVSRLHHEFGLMYEAIVRGNVAACCLSARFTDRPLVPKLPFEKARSLLGRA